MKNPKFRMISKAFLVLILAWLTDSASVQNVTEEKVANPLLIGAFNVQIFGKSKMSKPQVVDILVKIVQRYDLIVIQEIRDIDEVAFPQLVADVNAASTVQYDSILGPREGRSSSKEQYGFIYKHDSLIAKQQYLYADSKDIFEREPYVVTFERPTAAAGKQRVFNFIPLHAKPDEAVDELNALVDVYDDSISKTQLDNGFIGGDLNADCNYVTSSDWPNVELKSDDRFSWLIADNVDSTTYTTDCAYDRIIVMGDAMDANSYGATVFLYDDEYNLSYEEAIEVSDHYPVEFFLN